MTTRLLLLNVNTNTALTEQMGAVARAAAAADTEITTLQPDWGTPSVESYYDAAISVVAALDKLDQLPVDESWDALIWAGFGDQGREALQELLEIPVITIAEAAAHVAMLMGRSFGIVTTLHRSVPQIEDVLRTAGLLERCVGVWAIGIGVSAAASTDDADRIEQSLPPAHRALRAGAEVLCLGSGALAGSAPALSKRLGIPVIDGIVAATVLAEGCHRLNLRTSKINTFASPPTKERTHRPTRPEQSDR